jgi:NodT family efflux transporter outer membrane factor (OMF) lipoprotein
MQSSSTRKISPATLGCGLLLVTALLQGCNVGPKYKIPSVPTAAAFKETSTQTAEDGTEWKRSSPSDTLPKGAWWEIYQNPELNTLEARLNQSNQSVAEAFENYEAARALVRQARSQYFPQITTGLGYARSRVSANEPDSKLSSNLNSNQFTLPIDVSWEPDLWGQIRNQVRENANKAQASAAQLAAQKLSAQANLAIDYFELRGQDSLIQIYQQTVDTYQKSLVLTRTLKSTGVDSEQSVAQAESNLKSAEAALANLRVGRAQYEHAIALLVGEPASSFSLPVRDLENQPPSVPVGIPSEMLERRPDVASAERTVAAANALIGIGKAAFYPTLTISGEGGVESTDVGNWLNWPSRFFSIGPSASETLFDAGSRRATLDNYKAQYQADVASYRQTVLTAFQQTEDALASQKYLASQYNKQNEATAATKKYRDLAEKLFQNGIDSYLDVATAQTLFLQGQQSCITIQIQRMTSNVQLIEAIGGGWDKAALPSEKDVANR